MPIRQENNGNRTTSSLNLTMKSRSKQKKCKQDFSRERKAKKLTTDLLWHRKTLDCFPTRWIQSPSGRAERWPYVDSSLTSTCARSAGVALVGVEATDYRVMIKAIRVEDEKEKNDERGDRKDSGGGGGGGRVDDDLKENKFNCGEGNVCEWMAWPGLSLNVDRVKSLWVKRWKKEKC